MRAIGAGRLGRLSIYTLLLVRVVLLRRRGWHLLAVLLLLSSMNGMHVGLLMVLALHGGGGEEQVWTALRCSMRRDYAAGCDHSRSSSRGMVIPQSVDALQMLAEFGRGLL